MACYHPLHGWRARTRNASGARSVVFNVSQGYADFPVDVPCGQCIGCRLERSRQWAVRCMHEASLHLDNCFITLTYRDEWLPAGGSLDRRAFPLFMKRLRKRFSNDRIRYFHCGEYGEESRRPHYHACIFGFDFPDKRVWAQRGEFMVYRSPALEDLWPFGNSEVGSVSYESAAYVARYVMKKVTGEAAFAHYSDVVPDTGEVISRAPEYTTMSRRPGIGMEWLRKFRREVYPSDSVVVRGRLCRPPRAYDKTLSEGELEDLRELRESKRIPGEDSYERLEAREKCARAGVNLKRGL